MISECLFESFAVDFFYNSDVSAAMVFILSVHVYNLRWFRENYLKLMKFDKVKTSAHPGDLDDPNRSNFKFIRLIW